MFYGPDLDEDFDFDDDTAAEMGRASGIVNPDRWQRARTEVDFRELVSEFHVTDDLLISRPPRPRLTTIL